MNKVVLKILDEVNIKFEGLDIPTRRKLVASQKYFLPHAYHTPAYKLGRWDGTVSFCTLGAASYFNLLDELLPIVLDDGYEIEIDDRRQQWEFDFPKVHEKYLSELGYVWPEKHDRAGQPIELRDYQVRIINDFLENPQSIQEAATGAGKTIITATLSKMIEPYGKTIVIVPNKSLVVQTEADYLNLGLDVGVYYGERKDLDKTHTICTWQSLEALERMCKKKELDENLLYTFAEDKIAVIVDETHQAKADVLRKLLTGPFAHCPIRYGLTGTIPKDDFGKKSLVSSIGLVTSRLAAHELQEKGVLSSCKVNVKQLYDVIEAKDYKQEKDYLLKNKPRIEFLSKMIQEIIETGNTLVLVDRVETGKLLAEYIKDSIFISGSTKLDDRKEHYDEVAVTDGKGIIATYGVAAVGINVPRIFNLVLLEPGKSFVRVIQSIGRGIRKAKDKDHVEIFDICSTAKYSKKHLTERKKFYNEQKYPFSIEKIEWQ